ncbi:nuclear transport factor 2 family protein [Nocardia vinacea]|uniref:Nuclear transport factor 2 family protein n=1 Tax=Nocardia vinacea TaxID=96468 RepID=A0ABZ1YTR7_9NOCA|nr:nuclear transport factor 2 family protein [Nocardia vinacea]
MTDHDDIVKTIHLYSHVVDTKEWHRLREVFDEKGAFVVAGTPVEAQGLAAVEEFMRGFGGHPLAHFMTNVVVDIDGDGDNARALSMVFGPAADGTASIGRYADTLTRTPGGWRIARRDVTVISRNWSARAAG